MAERTSNFMRGNNSRRFLLVAILSLALVCVFSAAPFAAFAQGGSSAAHSGRIGDSSSEVGVQPSFQTDDFVFLVKKENGEFEAAGPNNVTDRTLVSGMTAAARHLSENPEFRSMLDFYKKSHMMRYDERKAELAEKIKETEELLAKKKISSRTAKMEINLYNEELRKINEMKVPPLAIVVGRNPQEKTSYMLASPIEFRAPAAAGDSSRQAPKAIEAPGYIMLQYEEFVNLASDRDRHDGLSVLAHETGHVISNNLTGMRNVTLDYKDRNPLFLVDESLRNDSAVVEFMRKGDPMPESHWRAKVINSQTAFEEGFAEFTAAFFTSAAHDGDGIADKDFLTNKIGYRLNKSTDEVSATLEWSDEVKNSDELMRTEFFIAKILNRIAMSYDDPYQAYKDIMEIKATDEFVKSPNLNVFMKLFAAKHPEAFEKFKAKFAGEIDAIEAENTRRIQTDEKQKIIALLKETSSMIMSIGQLEIDRLTAETITPGADGTGEATVKYGRTVSRKYEDDVRPESVKIKVMSEKIKTGEIDREE